MLGILDNAPVLVDNFGILNNAWNRGQCGG